MTIDEQIKACAELYGWKYKHTNRSVISSGWFEPDGIQHDTYPPDYDTYNSIIPLVQKWCGDSCSRWYVFRVTPAIENNSITFSCLQATPAQLREALLRAAGKWTK